MNERRAARRVAPEQPLRAKVFASFPVRVVDISERGAQLEVERSLRPNVGCELRFPSPEGELVLRATVRRCRAWGFAVGEGDQRVLVFRAGVEFDRPDPELLQRLRLVTGGEGHAGPPQGAGATPGAEGPLPGDPTPAAGPAPPGPTPAQTPVPPVRGPVKIRIKSDYVRRILQS